MQIALELIEKIKKFKGQGVHGLHIMAVGWEEIVPRIVTEGGVLPPDFAPPAAPVVKEQAAAARLGTRGGTPWQAGKGTFDVA